MPRTKITTYDGLIRQIVSYFGSYKSDEKLRIITEWIMDNVHVDDLDTLYEYILRENTFSPGIREIQASYSEMAKRSQRASDKHVIQQKRDEQAARSDKTDWSKPIPESKAQLQVGDIFAICWTMCVRDEYLKALEMGKELSQDRIRDYESAGIKHISTCSELQSMIHNQRYEMHRCFLKRFYIRHSGKNMALIASLQITHCPGLIGLAYAGT
jgi:uncharacterized protein YfkK (UPF0435 family)